jgi:hypothetical protein
MTSSDVVRMHQDLQRRLGQVPPDQQQSPRQSDRPSVEARRRRRWVAAVAAVAAVAVAAAVVGALWVRRPPPPRPAGPTLSEEIVGVWWHSNSSLSVVFHADGTARFFTDPEGVLIPAGTYWSGTPDVISARASYRISGDTLGMSMQDSSAHACDYTFTTNRPRDGQADLTPVSQVGPGCVTDALSSPFTMVRISPASPAGLNLNIPADSVMAPVTGTARLYGVWLLKGTGTVLAVAAPDISAAVPYRIDHDGTIDTSTDNSGLTVPTAGQVVLKSTDPSTCGDTILRNATAGANTFTATVATDPCNQFAGQTSLRWLRIP